MAEIISSTTKVHSAILSGDAKVIGASVSCTYRAGAGVTVKGVADSAAKESLLRVSAALASVGFNLPGRKVEVAVEPATQWRGRCTTHLDLPMAVAFLEHAKGPRRDGGAVLLAGELGPDGSLRPTWTTQALWREAEEGGIPGRTLYLPRSPEASGRPAPAGVKVVSSLRKVIAELW